MVGIIYLFYSSAFYILHSQCANDSVFAVQFFNKFSECDLMLYTIISKFSS